MSRIVVNYRALQNAADAIEGHGRTVETSLQELDGQVGRLRSTFTGTAASAFFEKYDQKRRQMVDWDDLVRSFATQLRADAERFAIAENEIINQINN